MLQNSDGVVADTVVPVPTVVGALKQRPPTSSCRPQEDALYNMQLGKVSRVMARTKARKTQHPRMSTARSAPASLNKTTVCGVGSPNRRNAAWHDSREMPKCIERILGRTLRRADPSGWLNHCTTALPLWTPDVRPQHRGTITAGAMFSRSHRFGIRHVHQSAVNTVRC